MRRANGRAGCAPLGSIFEHEKILKNSLQTAHQALS